MKTAITIISTIIFSSKPPTQAELFPATLTFD